MLLYVGIETAGEVRDKCLFIEVTISIIVGLVQKVRNALQPVGNPAPVFLFFDFYGNDIMVRVCIRPLLQPVKIVDL